MEEPREIAERATILRCQVGSGLHGTAMAGTDDRDEMGICIAPARFVAGLAPFEQYVHRTAWERTGTHRRSREQPRSRAGDLDLIVYSLRKWMRLALAANPTVLLPLFAPPSERVTLTPLGRELIALTPSILSRRAARTFSGYAASQRRRLLGVRGRHGRPRPANGEGQDGYDGKSAMHMLRLGIQGVELLETGRITLPVPQPDLALLRAVRAGEVPLPEVLDHAQRVERRLTALERESPLPAGPDVDAVDDWLVSAHLRSWAAEGSPFAA